MECDSCEGKRGDFREFLWAAPIAALFALVYVGLQKSGLLGLTGDSETVWGTAFIVGIVSSLSTCMAVVGGLVLSMSATFAKEGDRWKPQALFHVGRLVSFFILGGIIGKIGSAFTLGIGSTFVLGLLTGLVMLFLGLRLLDVFPWAKHLSFIMPRYFSDRTRAIAKWNHRLTPFVIGVATFFLPCGFTQSMQVFTLSSGGFFDGGLTMLLYALGTFPVLAALTWSAYSFEKGPKSGIFFKSAGLIVILFALFNIANSLAVIGAIKPMVTF